MKTHARLISLAALTWFSGTLLAHTDDSWIGTWETSPAGLPTVENRGPVLLLSPKAVQGTIRVRLRISQGGGRVRLRFSNEYRDTPLTLGAASVGLAGKGLEAIPGSLRRATFAGKTAIIIPAGAPALSDPIDLPVTALRDLVVSAYVPEGVTTFSLSGEPSPTDPGVVEDLNATLMEHLPKSKAVSMRPIVSAVSVLSDRPRKVIVTLGDSITEGEADPATGEFGWPGALSRRLQSRGVSVVNAGIGGNRLLQSIPYFGASALSRWDSDVGSVPGFSHLILLEGINDIGFSGQGGWFGDVPLVTPEELIAAYSQIAARCHERGIKVIGGTILPFGGGVYYSQEKEQIRATVNAWIRTSSTFDGLIDFDLAMRDPARPDALIAQYDSGDHVHPNAAGYRHMGDVIELRLFN